MGSALQLQTSLASPSDLSIWQTSWYDGSAAGEVAEWLKAAPC